MLEIYDFPFVDNLRGVMQTICKNKYLSSLCIFIIETTAGYSDPLQADAVLIIKLTEYYLNIFFRIFIHSQLL